MQRRSVMFQALRGRPALVRTLDVSLLALIVLAVCAAILETVPSVRERFGAELHAFDVFSVVVFTIEYVLRLATCTAHPSGRFGEPVRGRLRFALTPMALVDLAAIAPFYLEALLPVDLRFLRVLRLFRIFKLTRYSAAMSILLGVLRDEARSFGAALFILMVILILAASGIYLVESDVQPEAFGSIPAAMWWAVATLTTVGYGDVTPITAGGKVFGAIVTIVGIGMVALPAGILASAFSDHLRRRRESFAEQVGEAASDGAISAAEARELEAMRTDLGLGEDEAARLVASAREEAAATGTCPHCGKALGSAG